MLSSGVPSVASALNNGAIVVSPSCGLFQINCFQVFDDGQVVDDATYVATTLMTTHTNDAGAISGIGASRAEKFP
jgi:hypothetical protein